jgi:DNA-binding beta-propeller fold protein YncE
MAYVSATDGGGAGVVVPIDLTTNRPGTPMLTPPGVSVTGIAVSSDGKVAYATMVKTGTNTGTVVPIDLKTNSFGPAIPTVLNAPPLAIAITPDGKTAYVIGAVAAANGRIITTAAAVAVLAAVDVTTNTLMPRLSIPHQIPFSIAISPNGKTVFMTDVYGGFIIGQPGGVVEPIDLATNSLGAGLPPPINTYPRAIAITPDGKTAYVVAEGTGSGGEVVPIYLTGKYLTSGAPIQTPNGTTPFSITIAPNGKTAYVMNIASAGGNGSVMPIDLVTNTAGPLVAIEGNPVAIAIAPDGETLYVTGQKSSRMGGTIVGAIDGVWPIDLMTNTVMAPILVGSNPATIAIAP